MLNIIIKAIFTIISKIGDVILLPLTTFVSALIPSFSDFYNYILDFIDYAFTYLSFFIKLLCIPHACITVVFTVATLTLTITVGVRAYALIMKVYEKFKP